MPVEIEFIMPPGRPDHSAYLRALATELVNQLAPTFNRRGHEYVWARGGRDERSGHWFVVIHAGLSERTVRRAVSQISQANAVVFVKSTPAPFVVR
jgi:hypothetical protein